MTAATVYISESNTVSETVTADVTNVNHGSTDAVNLVAADYPITADSYGYEKYNRVKLHAKNDSSYIKNIKTWISSDPTPDVFLTSAKTSAYSEPSFATPVNTVSSKAVNAQAYSEPAVNLGIDGSILDTAHLDADGEYSDYLVTQLHVHSSSTAGKSLTQYWKYEEVA